MVYVLRSGDLILSVCAKSVQCVCQIAAVVSNSVTLWTLSPPGSSVHGILQASILEWVAMPLLLSSGLKLATLRA